MRISHFTMLALILGAQAGMLDHKAGAQDLDGVVFVDDIETAARQQSSGPALPMLRGSAPSSVSREMLTAPQHRNGEASTPAATAQRPLLGNPFGWLKRDTQPAEPAQASQGYAQQQPPDNSRMIRDAAVKPAAAHMQRRPGQGFQTRDTRGEHKTGILSGLWGQPSGSQTAGSSGPSQQQASRTARVAPPQANSQQQAIARSATSPSQMARKATLSDRLTGNQPQALRQPMPMRQPIIEATGLQEPSGTAWVDDKVVADDAAAHDAIASAAFTDEAIAEEVIATDAGATAPMPPSPVRREPAAGSVFAKNAGTVKASPVQSMAQPPVAQPVAVTNPHAKARPVESRSNMPLPMEPGHQEVFVAEAPLAKQAETQVATTRRPLAAKQQPAAQNEMKVAAVENPVMPVPTSEATPSPRAASLLVEANSIAQSAATEEEFSQIIQMCRHVLAIDGTQSAVAYSKNLASWALNRRGEIKADAGRESEAGLDFDDAIRFDTASWRAIHNRGVLKAQQGDFAGANADFNQTIALNPKFAKAYSNRAALAVQDGNLAQACEDYRIAIQLDNDLAIAHKGRGRVCHLLGQLDQALQHLEAAAELAPGDSHIANSRADLLMDMGRYHEAVEGYRTAIGLDASMAESHRDLAWLLATCPASDCRNAQQALASIERAVSITGEEDDLSLDTLAAAKANAGDFVAAVATQQRAIALTDEAHKAAYQARLDLYEKQQPYRTEPASDVQQATFVE